MERKGAHTTMPDNMNQTPSPSALSEAHHGVVAITRERDTVQCAAAGPGISPALRSASG